MRAMAVVDYAEPLRSIDAPQKTVPAGHALVEVLTCGVCATDLKIVRGQMPFSASLSLPHIPGHEIYGRVVRTEPPGIVEAGTTVVVYQYRPCGRCVSCARGDEVMCLAMRTWTGFVDPGGFQEHVVAAIDRLVEVPASVPPVHAAPLTCAIGTAYRATVTRGGAGFGDTVVLIGLGGVGIHAAQFAMAAGATVIGVDPHGPTLDLARELGITALAAGPDVTAEILDRVPTGVDVAIDTVATEATTAVAADVVRRGGRIVVIGHGASTNVKISTRRLVLDEIQVVGSRYAGRDEMAHAIAAVAAGRIRSIVGMTRPLAEVNDVLLALDRGEVVGRAVIDVAGVA